MEEVLEEARKQIEQITRKPEKFLQVQDDVFHTSKVVAKILYDTLKVEENHSPDSLDTMGSLIVEDFDEEQIWTQLQMQNKIQLAMLKEKIGSWTRVGPAGKQMNLLLGDPELKSQKAMFRDVANKGLKRKIIDSENGEEDSENEEEDLGGLNVEQHDQEESESEEEEEEEQQEGEQEEEDEDDPLLDPAFANMSDSDGDDLPLFDREDDEITEESEDSDEEREKQEQEDKRQEELDEKADDYMSSALKSLKGAAGRKTEVDDQFFKMSEMEKFLDAEDASEERRRLREEKKPESEDEDDEDDIDYFGADEDEDEDEERIMYKDYFTNDDKLQQEAEDGSENENEEEEEEEDDSAEERSAANPGLQDLLANSDDSDQDVGEVKSTFEERQMRLKKKIKKMEEEAVSKEKPWQLQGEITGPMRPENSLLQEHLDYDMIAKQAPIITEEVSKRLEDIILQRVKDKAWDDVERKIKPTEDPYEYKKKLVLDQEKSKLSLAQVYEQEYLKQQGAVEDSKKIASVLDKDDEGPEITKEVETIKKSMNNLFAKLDTLTHVHFTPKNLSAEVKVIKNMPSIAMEEVAPVVASDANLLAPQEIADSKRGELLGSTEREETDRKRERRKKKLHQRKVQQDTEKRQKVVDKLNPGLGNKYSKEKMLKDLEKEEKKGNLTTIKDDKKSAKTVKSSTAFFNQLQEETTAAVKNISGKKSQQPSKKKRKIAKQMKL